ncbi:MAG TPA: ribose-phosphate pyrophosphokinase [Gammaproteobacteria bacterium]
MTKLVVSMPGSGLLADRLAAGLCAEHAEPRTRRFPDGESYVRLDTDCENKDLIVVGSLDRPDEKFLQLIFLCDLLRELGAARVVLCAPYLAYMRQDKRFRAGEAVTSQSFARILCRAVDGLVTVDPHLHRYRNLGDLYNVPTRVGHAAGLIADWIKTEVRRPLLVGPDSESEQWVADVAARAGVPHIVLEKTRRGDRDVEVSVPEVERWRDHRPVLVDDIISTAGTMIETVRHLGAAGLSAPMCVGVHGVFADDAHGELLGAGVQGIVTTNTIAHETNGIDVSGILIEALDDLFGE